MKINWAKMPKRTTKAEVKLWLEVGMVKPYPQDEGPAYNTLYIAWDSNGNKTAIVMQSKEDGVVYGATSDTHNMCSF